MSDGNFFFLETKKALLHLPINEKSYWQIEKNKQRIATTKRGHRCSRSAFGKVRFLGH